MSEPSSVPSLPGEPAPGPEPPPHWARRRVLALAAGAAAVAATGSTLAGRGADDPLPPRRLAATTTTRPAPTTTSPPGLPELPYPGPIPFDQHQATPEEILGRLEIPVLGVDEPLQVGMTLTAINRGPSHWPGTARPGQLGNMVVAGHRVTYSRPFNRLDELVAGDQVVFRLADDTVHTYALTEVVVIGPEDLWIADQTYQHTATLFACHPKGSARQRIVAKLDLLGADGVAVDATRVPESDLRRDAFTWELFTLPPDAVLRPGEPRNLSARGVVVQEPSQGRFERRPDAESDGAGSLSAADPFAAGD